MGTDHKIPIDGTYSFSLKKSIVFSGCKDQKEAWELLRTVILENLSDSDIVLGHPIFDMFDVHKEVSTF